MASGSSWKLNIPALGLADLGLRWCARLVTDPPGGYWLMMFDKGPDSELFEGVEDTQGNVYYWFFLELVAGRSFPCGYVVDDYCHW